MATVRLIVVLLGLGIVVLLGMQNMAPALPLVFLGGNTQTLPLGVWLVSAIALGALTTLVFTVLLGSVGGASGGRGGRSGGRSGAYKYRPESFYEPAESVAGSSYPASGSSRSGASPSPRSGNDDPTWRAWGDLKSPGQWNDWETLSQAPKPETNSSGPAPAGSSLGQTASGLVEGVTTWFSSSKRQAKQQQRVNDSLQALDDDWDGLENRRYPAPGASPVQDSLDDINQGWDRGQGSDPNRGFEAPQSARRVYQDGSLYSYSYRGDDDPPAGRGGQVDNIYAPPDDVAYGDAPGYGADYRDDAANGTAYGSDDGGYDGDGYDEGDSPEFDNDDAPLGDPEIAEDGVVDADYRVIVPPYTAPAEAAATSETWVAKGDKAVGDDWDDTDDALTP